MAKKEKNKKEDMKEVELKATNIFFKNMHSPAIVRVNRGGAGSSKSYSLMQLIVYKFLTEKNKKFLIVRKALPSLKLSVLLDLYTILGEKGFNIRDRVLENKNNMNFYYGSNLLHLGSVDDPEKYRCFHPDTEVFTDKGWKNIKDIKIDDVVGSLNPLTKKGEFKKVTNIFSYNYKGKMIQPASINMDRGSYADFCVTPNHNMITHTRRKKDLKFIQAGNLPRTYYIPQAAEFDYGNIIKYFEIPKLQLQEGQRKNNKFGKKSTIFPIVPWLKFLGWYLSEGSLSKSSTGSECVVNISQVKQKGIRQIEEDLKDFPYDIKYNKAKRTFELYGKDLYAYLKQFGKCKDKYIPREILDLHPILLKHLFSSLVAGDGSIVSKNKITYATTSYQLANDVSEIATKLGFCTAIIKTRHKDKIDCNNPQGKWNDAWQVLVCKRINNEIRLENKKEIDYDGKVYCVEVPPYHTLLTRFHGKVAFTGNSTDWNVIWMEEATNFTYQDYILLRARLRAQADDGTPNAMFLSFNPIDELHWIRTELLEKHKDVEEIHSTYQDNPFLERSIIDYYENSKDFDFNFYRVHALGEWGRLTNVIYSQWDTVSSMPVDGTEVFGMDFGFNDPSVIIRVIVKERDAFVEQLLYKRKLTNTELIQQAKILIPESKRSRPIYADSAEPDRIREFRLAGFNIKPAQKSIKDGIDFVKSFKLHIHEGSVDILKEIQGYSYKTDRQGNVIDEPIPGWDHTMDGIRYPIFSHFRTAGTYGIYWL